jgi:CTP:molybdopterin cytidylyltransferase MocA
MGGPKVFTYFEGSTFLERILARAREAGAPVILTVDPIFRVGAVALVSKLPPHPVRLVDADGTQPMLASVQTGLGIIEPGAAGAWVWPVDAQLLSADGWRRAREAVTATPHAILKLRTRGRTGHPTWFPRWACEAILSRMWGEGLLGFLRTVRPDRIAVLELDSETIRDFNTPEQLTAARHE